MASWRKINSARNSECGSAKLAELDWSEWWTDDSFESVYLHVRHRDGETVHRVRCRQTQRPRIGFRNGMLCWLIDR